MASSRLQKYLQTLERVPVVADAAAVRNVFLAANVPTFDPLIEFHCNYAGYLQHYGLNRFVWGLFHQVPDVDSFFEPNRLCYEKIDGHYYFTCCNCHISDHWFLDETGAFYWCSYTPLATSFEKKLERDAVAWELDEIDEAFFPVDFEQPIQNVLSVLVPRLEKGLISEASDQIESLYRHGNLYAAVKGDEIICVILGSEASDLLDGISYWIRKR